MSSEVIAALISLIGVICSAVTSLQLVNWRLKKLEEKVDKHNSYSDKIAEMGWILSLLAGRVSYSFLFLWPVLLSKHVRLTERYFVKK